jgi:hypothetical protein
MQIILFVTTGMWGIVLFSAFLKFYKTSIFFTGLAILPTLFLIFAASFICGMDWVPRSCTQSLIKEFELQ